MEIKNKNPRKINGTVVSDKMQKTAVVEVLRLRKHPKYKEYIKSTIRLKAHNEGNQYHTGDKVIVQEVRPLSKEKRWAIIGRAE